MLVYALISVVLLNIIPPNLLLVTIISKGRGNLMTHSCLRHSPTEPKNNLIQLTSNCEVKKDMQLLWLEHSTSRLLKNLQSDALPDELKLLIRESCRLPSLSRDEYNYWQLLINLFNKFNILQFSEVNNSI